MIDQDVLLKRCLALIEQKMDWPDSSGWRNSHFEELAQEIWEETRIQLSAMTLKRVWGKVQYHSLPSPNTLDTLAQFIGYKNWIDFEKCEGEQKIEERLPNEASSPAFPLKRILIPVLLALSLVLLSYMLWPNEVEQKADAPQIDSSGVSFEFEPLTTGIPNTVIFRYNAAQTQADSVFIQQSWDPRLRNRVAKDQDYFASTYYLSLIHISEYESRKLKWQKAQAEKISAENKVLASRNEVINSRVELSSIEAQYQDKIAKSESDKFSALSGKYDAEATLSKLQNQYANYSVRQGLYYITAPQNGFITKAIQSGLGETVKSGEEMVSIMPAKYELAVEMYVKPLDLPLLNKEQEVRIMFDGWPAIVFSGWPNTSVGTYGGKVFAIDNFISENGMYRVLVAPDESEHVWPTALRVGAGTQSMVLLNEVPVWYELWRQINDFPPDFYTVDKKKEEKAKAPIKLK